MQQLFSLNNDLLFDSEVKYSLDSLSGQPFRDLLIKYKETRTFQQFPTTEQSHVYPVLNAALDAWLLPVFLPTSGVQLPAKILEVASWIYNKVMAASPDGSKKLILGAICHWACESLTMISCRLIIAVALLQQHPVIVEVENIVLELLLSSKFDGL